MHLVFKGNRCRLNSCSALGIIHCVGSYERRVLLVLPHPNPSKKRHGRFFLVLARNPARLYIKLNKKEDTHVCAVSTLRRALL